MSCRPLRVALPDSLRRTPSRLPLLTGLAQKFLTFLNVVALVQIQGILGQRHFAVLEHDSFTQLLRTFCCDHLLPLRTPFFVYRLPIVEGRSLDNLCVLEKRCRQYERSQRRKLSSCAASSTFAVVLSLVDIVSTRLTPAWPIVHLIRPSNICRDAAISCSSNSE